MRIVTSFLVALSLTSFAIALPLEGAQQPKQRIVPRAKSYSVVNVDGGATPPPPETVIETVTHPAPVPTKTETIKITDIAAPLPPVATTTESTSSSSSLPPSHTTTSSTSSTTSSSSSKHTSS